MGRKRPSEFKCKKCGGPWTKDSAKGLCARCYHRAWVAANRERDRAHKSAHYERGKRAGLPAQQRDKRYFDGKRARAVERDGSRCAKCGRKVRTKGSLIVHHKDGRGRGCAQPNNRLSNLETVCRRCHPSQHKLRRWSRQHDACRICGREDRKHNAHGLCVACYSRLEYQGELATFIERGTECPATRRRPPSRRA